MTAPTWSNERRKLSALIPWPRNPRQIKGESVRRLQESFEEFGQPEVIAISPSNDVYNGHQRLKSWFAKFGDIEVDVRVASRPLTEKERERLTVLLHRGAVGEWNFETLANEFEVGELLEWGFTEMELGLDGAVAVNGDAEPQIDRAEELRLKWGVEPGDLWRIGEHRLVCGDCTDAAVVERVMGGERAALMVTDPPYGVDHKNDKIPTKSHKEHSGIANDERSADGFIKRFISSLQWFDGTFYIFGATIQFVLWYENLNAWRKVNQVLVWVKDNSVLSRLHYNLKYELIYHGYQSNGTWNGDNKQDDVLIYRNVNSFGYLKDDGERNAGNDAQVHPNQKPIDMFRDFVQIASNQNDIVYEPFLGSGTTMVACQNLGRRCRAVEIAPGYVAVALERMATAFPGIVIERVGE